MADAARPNCRAGLIGGERGIHKAGNAVGMRRMGEQRLVVRPSTSFARRVGRWLGADRNPLRRRTDRVESAVRLVLLLVFLGCGPLLAGLTGRWTLAAGQHQVRQQQSWHQVRAVLLRPAPQQQAHGWMTTYWVPGRWQEPSGAIRSGEVPVSAGVPAGAPVRIWVNGAGRVTGRQPLTMRVVVLRVILAELVTLAGLAIVLLIVAALASWQLNRRRMACWTIEWAAFGPRWTTRR